MAQQVRRIREELYRDRGYDAIWRLPNAGFVLRLGGAYVFLDPILSSPHPHYLATRNKITATGELTYFHEELKYYELEEVSQEVHEAPLTSDEVEAADHVLITHGHEDHLDDLAIRALSALGQGRSTLGDTSSGAGSRHRVRRGPTRFGAGAARLPTRWSTALTIKCQKMSISRPTV